MRIYVVRVHYTEFEGVEIDDFAVCAHNALEAANKLRRNITTDILRLEIIGNYYFLK